MLYPPERLAAIAKEAAKPEASLFTFEDRIGLINDSPALAKAGLIQLSSTLTLIDNFRNETECKCTPSIAHLLAHLYTVLVWSSIADSLAMIVTTWWEHTNIINYLDEFRRVGFFPFRS